MSSGNVWLRPVSATLTSTIVPASPETEIVDGYGLAGPEVVPGAPAGIVIGAVLEKIVAAAGMAMMLARSVASSSEHDAVAAARRVARCLTEGRVTTYPLPSSPVSDQRGSTPGSWPREDH